MKYLKSIPAKKLMIIGLLLVVLPTLFRDEVPVPQFISGFLVGLGLGIEIIAAIKLKSEKTTRTAAL